MSKQLLHRAVRPVHKYVRRGKSELFLRLVDSTTPGCLLDVGGSTGMDGEFSSLYRRFRNVTVVNLRPPDLDRKLGVDVRVVAADGCTLPFADRSFDWVFSNAVIEHVGSWERQRLFAAELRRVASEGYFVATPNRYFPIEPHSLLPFYQFYPAALKTRALRFSPGYMRRVEEINLLSPRQLRLLFPEADVRRIALGSALIALHRVSIKFSRVVTEARKSLTS